MLADPAAPKSNADRILKDTEGGKSLVGQERCRLRIHNRDNLGRTASHGASHERHAHITILPVFGSIGRPACDVHWPADTMAVTTSALSTSAPSTVSQTRPDARLRAPARTGAEAIFQLLVACGVEYVFLNPGTDTAPIQEALVALAAADRAARHRPAQGVDCAVGFPGRSADSGRLEQGVA